jgi:hypothetical protein
MRAIWLERAGAPKGAPLSVAPFTIGVPDEVFEDLRCRLAHTRLPDALEEPAALVEDIRAFFRPLRG